MSCTIRRGGAASAASAAVLGKQHLRGHSRTAVNIAPDTCTSLKIYSCSFIFNNQQGTDSSHINPKTMQWKDLWAPNENSYWLLSNPAVIYISLWYAKLLKLILVKNKTLPRKVKALPVPWGEATAVDTVLGAAQMPLLCCSTRNWRSDEQVKNNLKNRDKNIPTRVKCGTNVTNTILCVPVPGQVWRSCLSAGKNEAEIEKKECLCVWDTSCKIPWISPLHLSAQQWFS